MSQRGDRGNSAFLRDDLIDTKGAFENLKECLVGNELYLAFPHRVLEPLESVANEIGGEEVLFVFGRNRAVARFEVGVALEDEILSFRTNAREGLWSVGLEIVWNGEPFTDWRLDVVGRSWIRLVFLCLLENEPFDMGNVIKKSAHVGTKVACVCLDFQHITS